MRAIDEIVIHCTATHSDWREDQTIEQKVAEVRRWHVDQRGWRDIGYHFLIDRDGSVLPGRPLEQAGAHVKGQNANSIGIALFGGATSAADDAFSENFTEEQEAALVGLIDGLIKEYPDITTVSGHNQYAAKACPGFNAPDWWEGVQAALEAAKDDEVTNIFGEDTIILPEEPPQTSTEKLKMARDLINQILEQVNA